MDQISLHAHLIHTTEPNPIRVKYCTFISGAMTCSVHNIITRPSEGMKSNSNLSLGYAVY